MSNKSIARSRGIAAGLGTAMALAMVATSAPVQAQEAADEPGELDTSDDGSGLGEIIVTAQFRETRVQDTPIAITAISADMLERRSQNDIADIAAQAPNVTLKAQAGVWGPSISSNIRGIGGSIDPHPAFSPGVGIYIDDVFYTSTVGAVFDLLDLDRIEILRGPQGTNAGANSIGGAVKLYTRKPNGEGGYAEATYGSRDRIDLRASGDFTIVPDQVFMRISGVSKSQDGHVRRLDYACSHPGSGLPSFATSDDCVLGTMGGIDYKALRGALRVLPSDNVELNLTADIIRDDSELGGVVYNSLNNVLDRVKLNGVPYDSRFNAPDPYTNYASYYMPGGIIEGVPNRTITATPNQRYEGWGTAGTLDWEVSDTIQLTSISAYRQFRAKWTGDVDGSPLGLGLDFQDIYNKQYSQEVRLSGDLAGGALEYTVGGYYLHRWAAYRPQQYFIYQSPAYDYVNDDRIKNDSLAGFANLAWHVTDRFNLVGGLRYTHEKKSFALRRYTQSGETVPGYEELNSITSKYKKGTWDWSVSADYKITPDIMAYGSIATGYRSGGNTPRPFAPDQALPFGPESIVNYELGLKNTLFDNRLRLNLAAFYSELQDVQFTLLACPEISTFPTCGVTANAGDAEVKGFEAELTAEPIDDFLIDASMSHVDFEYTRVSPLAGNQVVRAYSPEWKWSVGAQYDFAVEGFGTITPRLDASYTDEVFSSGTPRPTARIASYTLVNGRLTWRSEADDWSVALEVTNITDKVYYTSNADLSFIPVIGFAWNAPGRPREWAVTVRRNF
jgi:iron complex outermembrane receptor protein